MTEYTSNGSFSTGFSSQCFPVRSLANYRRVDEGGAWLVAYRAEQRRRFKAVLSNEPVQQIEPDASLMRKRQSPELIQEKAKRLDGFYLMRKFYVEDPSDLCSINISGNDLSEVSEDDFLLFDNVVHVDAGDNNLPFNAFKNFISLRELEIPLNNISGSIRLEPHDFLYLEKLDLSYNRVTSEDILDLGLLPCLKTLHLTGNEIKRLPLEMARTYRAITGITLSGTVESEDRKVRFQRLENLFMDNNELTDTSTFSSLAGLRRLKYLNLENNEVASIPHLRLLGARVRQSEGRISVQKERETAKERTAEQNEQKIEDEREVEGRDTPEADKDDLVLDGVDEMLSKKLPGDDKDEMTNGMGIRHRSSTLTEDASLLGEKYNPPLPFPSLLHLNLANNMVFEEEGLFAVAGWPRIKELVIWGNPLTTAFKGDPPLLSIRLGKLKGVRIFRQKPVKRTKHHVNLSNVAQYRKVDDTLPPAPRKRDIFMLESPSKREAISYVGPQPRPLPPISAPSGIRTRHQSRAVTPRQLSTAPNMADRHTKNRKTDSRSRSVPPESKQTSLDRESMGNQSEEVKTTGEATSSVDTTNTRKHEAAGKKTQTDEGFFMTQIDEPEFLETPANKETPRPRKKKSRKAKHQHPDRPFSVEAKYKGYEDLLDVDENDPDIIIPKKIQESVRSLQYTLQHPLVFTEPQGNYKEKPKKKVEPKPKESRQSKVEEMSKLLDKMRMGNKIIESNLANVIEDYHKDPKLRKQFPKAKELLDEVQAKYNEVRMKSLRPSSEARRIFQPELVREPSEVESLGSSFLEEERQVLNELAKFKQRLDGRI
ncbi:X-ray radiation resistance-associated protein 1-like [Actinia tenebrosa]|uniref:X-ray radiation resistance-associated protein 1-like n=1 Tax=Actinia tenebrosa TaxID=6105 RepID=A0A6P8H9V2_ACTTE|nr:X-ray radiation resistance-associated protein 1-like [Actinia tenebrosa]